MARLLLAFAAAPRRRIVEESGLRGAWIRFGTSFVHTGPVSVWSES
jgi:hypothetical protein